MSIKIKTPEEIEKMRIAGQLAADVLVMIAPHVKAGVTTDELNTLCHNHIVEVQQAIPAPLNYHGFPKSICTSVNDVICHGIPNHKKLREGDIINLDITVIKDGYHGDTSAMFIVGQTTPLRRQLCKVAQESLYAAIKQVRPGMCITEIGAVIQPIVEQAGFSVVRDYCGHGIGSRVPRRAADPALPQRRQAGAETGHVLHHRAHGQQQEVSLQGQSQGWLDCHHQGRRRLRPVGTHPAGHRGWLRGAHPAPR
jgi:methionine aminopeptidase type I